jgi:hypothetical protein
MIRSIAAVDYESPALFTCSFRASLDLSLDFVGAAALKVHPFRKSGVHRAFQSG